MDNRRLIMIRRMKGYSPEDMAKCLNIDVNSYLAKEKGVSPFKLDEIQKILHLLGFTYEDIFMPSSSQIKATSVDKK